MQSGPQPHGAQVHAEFVHSLLDSPHEQSDPQVQVEQVQFGLPHSAGFSVVALLIGTIVPQQAVAVAYRKMSGVCDRFVGDPVPLLR